jgi:hypothetical protein
MRDRRVSDQKSFRSRPRIVSDNARCTLLIRGCRHMLLPAGRRCFRCGEKAKTGSSLPRWPFRRRKARRQAHASSHLQAKVSPATTIVTKDSPPCNRARKRLLRDAHGVFPRGLATHLRKCHLCKIRDGFLSGSFLHCRRVLSDDVSRAPHRGSKAMGQLGGGSPQLQLSAPYAHRPAQPSPVRGYLSHTSTPN